MEDDPQMILLYYLFDKKNITPGAFYNMTPGEQTLIAAFVGYKLENL